MSWHYVTESRESREVPDGEIAALVEDGTIKPDTLVWQDGLPDWKPARELLAEHFPASTAPSGDTAPVAATPRPATAESGTAFTPSTTVGTAPQTSGMAVASLVCGILSITACSIFAGIPGAICGHAARTQIRNSNGRIGGEGLAIAGLVMSYISIVIAVVAIGIYALVIVGAIGAASFQ